MSTRRPPWNIPHQPRLDWQMWFAALDDPRRLRWFALFLTRVLRFSDRTPYASAPGLLDFGQLLNYLVPAAVTLWLETDFYGSESLTTQKGDRDG